MIMIMMILDKKEAITYVYFDCINIYGSINKLKQKNQWIIII